MKTKIIILLTTILTSMSVSAGGGGGTFYIHCSSEEVGMRYNYSGYFSSLKEGKKISFYNIFLKESAVYEISKIKSTEESTDLTFKYFKGKNFGSIKLSYYGEKITKDISMFINEKVVADDVSCYITD